MAEETKSQGGSKILGTVLKVVLGVALIVLGGYLILRWLWAVKVVVEGCLPFALILAGLIALAIAKE